MNEVELGVCPGASSSASPFAADPNGQPWTPRLIVCLLVEVLLIDDSGQLVPILEKSAGLNVEVAFLHSPRIFHMAAARSLDAIVRMPGSDGQDSDSLGAYTMQAGRRRIVNFITEQ